MYTWFKKSKSLDLIFFANASYGGEANMRMRTTFSSKTKSAEFYPIFLALSFCLFRNIFGRSTLDKWRFLRIASNVTRNISRWSQCFSVILLVCLVVYVLRVTMNISQSFQNGVKKKEKGFAFQKCLKRSDRRIIKIKKKVFLIKEGVFYRLNQRIIPSRSIDIIFSILTETLQ